MGAATSAWPHTETDPQRRALLAAADRLLAGTPKRSTGNLSVVQLAVEAGVKYWVAAQKHPDLRDHFQQLATSTGNVPVAFRDTVDAHTKLVQDHAELRERCTKLQQLVDIYAAANNELALENQALERQLSDRATTVTPLTSRKQRREQQP